MNTMKEILEHSTIGAQSRLATAAYGALRRHDRDPGKAFSGFSDIVWKDASLLRELIGNEIVNAAMRDYLRVCAKDMIGAAAIAEKLIVPAQAGGEVHIRNDGHPVVGLADTSEGDAAQNHLESLSRRGPSPSDPNERGAVRERSESRITIGRPVFPARAARTGADIAAFAHLAPEVFGPTLSTGRDIKSLRFGELDKFLNGSAYDMAMAWCLKNHCEPASSTATIGETISDAILHRFDAGCRDFAKLAVETSPMSIRDFFDTRRLTRYE